MLHFIKDVSPRKRAKIENLFEFYQEMIGFLVKVKKFHIYKKSLDAHKKRYNSYIRKFFKLSKYIDIKDLITAVTSKLET